MSTWCFFFFSLSSSSLFCWHVFKWIVVSSSSSSSFLFTLWITECIAIASSLSSSSSSSSFQIVLFVRCVDDGKGLLCVSNILFFFLFRSFFLASHHVTNAREQTSKRVKERFSFLLFTLFCSSRARPACFYCLEKKMVESFIIQMR